MNNKENDQDNRASDVSKSAKHQLDLSKLKLEPIPPHYSPVRSMFSESKRIPYKAFESFEAAKQTEGTALIFEGDWGGQIYLTCPLKLIKCSVEDLRNLLSTIDEYFWDNLSGTGMYYEQRHVGDHIAGGMGGGVVLDDLWLHRRLIEFGLEQLVRKVLFGDFTEPTD